MEKDNLKRIADAVFSTDQLKRIADALDKNEFGLGAVSQFGRIADAMEEILRLVKKDMEKYEEKNKK